MGDEQNNPAEDFWPISIEARKELIAACVRLLKSPDERVTLRAVRVILDMDLANIRISTKRHQAVKNRAEKLRGIT